MNRCLAVALALLVGTRAARAEEQTIADGQLRPGVGVALIGLSFDLMVEAPRWYAAGQFALTPTTRRWGYGLFGGARAGAFLSDARTSPFVGAGGGWMELHSLEDGAPRSDGWAVTVEAGIAFRRDRRWFHPQLVLQAFFPIAQQAHSAAAPEHPVGLFFGARFFL